TTVSEMKRAPVAILENDTATPNATAATPIARLLLTAIVNARKNKAPAASPDENEQFLTQPSVTTKAGVNCRDPPNSCTSRGRTRPKLSLSVVLTSRPAPRIKTRNRYRVFLPSMPHTFRLRSLLKA